MQQLLSAITDVFLLLPPRVSNLERFWQILGILTFFKHIWILKSQMAMVTLGSTRFQWREIQICPPRTHALPGVNKNFQKIMILVFEVIVLQQPKHTLEIGIFSTF